VDFRKLYDDSKDIDAVVIATTEHTHAFAVLPAIKLGKHVYCEKPLAHNVWEARFLAEEAAKAKITTQMGTQMHAQDNFRSRVEWIQTGAIGPVRKPMFGYRAPGAMATAQRRKRPSRLAALGPLARAGAQASVSFKLHQRPAQMV